MITMTPSILRLSLALLLLSLPCVLQGQEKGPLSPTDARLPMQQVVPPPSSVPLVNPGMGLYRFDEYFGPIFDLWVNRWHRRVAFRFMSENMHSRRKYVTPPSRDFTSGRMG
jgi:hypothetical protein